jgi:hypothetical protein
VDVEAASYIEEKGGEERGEESVGENQSAGKPHPCYDRDAQDQFEPRQDHGGKGYQRHWQYLVVLDYLSKIGGVDDLVDACEDEDRSEKNAPPKEGVRKDTPDG